MHFVIAVIGRPNVGKSTLFNKLVGRQFAIVDGAPGVTRDRREAIAELGDMEFKIVDTAGLEGDLADYRLEKRMVEQTKKAVMDADLCLFVVDGRAGILADDIYFADWIRRGGKEVILLVNKYENKTGEIFDKQYYQLGLGQALAISAEHKEGFDLLYDKIIPYFEQYQKEFGKYKLDGNSENQEKFLQVAIIGKPNAGKSTFLNKLLGDDRLITGQEAGITRDSIAIDWKFEDYKIRLIDTAGIRKKSNITHKLEQLSLLDSFRSIRYAQIVIMLIDVTSTLDHQELAIASMVLKEGRGLVFAVNKFDLVKNDQHILDEFRFQLEKSLPQVMGTPIIPISALNGHNVKKIIKKTIEVYKEWGSYITTSKLNEWLKIAQLKHAPVMVRGKTVKLKYITQAKKRPPTFILFANYPKALKGAYERYLINSLKEYFSLKLIVIRLLIKKSQNPFEGVRYKKFSKKRIKGNKG